MPNYKGHLIGAAFCYLAVIVFLSIPMLSYTKYAQWFVATLAGSLFPDIDTKSKGQMLFYKLMFAVLLICFAYSAYFPATLLGICSITPLLTKHRGLFHRLWFLLFITASFAILFIWCLPVYKEVIISNALFFTLGFVSHLWLDMGFKRMIRL
jgi:membrane-bound metal-dependent hydrolase YbcI (DUF457 family)